MEAEVDLNAIYGLVLKGSVDPPGASKKTKTWGSFSEVTEAATSRVSPQQAVASELQLQR